MAPDSCPWPTKDTGCADVPGMNQQMETFSLILSHTLSLYLSDLLRLNKQTKVYLNAKKKHFEIHASFCL